MSFSKPASDTPEMVDSANLSTLPDQADSTAQFDASYTEQYYLFNFLLVTLEESCQRYARKVHLQEMHRSETWRKINIKTDRLYEWSYWSRLHDLELNEWANVLSSLRWSWFPGGQEPEDWEQRWLFHRTISALEKFRHDTIHRRWQAASAVLDVMRLPGYLGDEPRAQAIKKVYDLWQVKETREEAMKILREPRTITKAHQLLSKIQNLLEVSLFEYAERVYGKRLARKYWGCAESVELQVWEPNDELTENAHVADFYPMPSKNLFKSVFLNMRSLRNAASHRSGVSRWEVVKLLKSSVMITTLMGDRVQAIEIEILGEQWLTNRSRVQVLSRLQQSFFDADHNETDLESRDSSIRTPEPITKEAKKECFAKRERKRRYALAKVLLSSSLFKDARPRSRCIPECSFGQSLQANLYIFDDEGLLNEDGSVCYGPWILNEKEFKERSLENDAISLLDLPCEGEPRDDDWGWGVDPTDLAAWNDSIVETEIGVEGKEWIAGAEEETAQEAESYLEQEDGKEEMEEAVLQEERHDEYHTYRASGHREEQYIENDIECGTEYDDEGWEECNYEENECEEAGEARGTEKERWEPEMVEFMTSSKSGSGEAEEAIAEIETVDPQTAAANTGVKDPAPADSAPSHQPSPPPTTPLDPTNPFASFEFPLTYEDIQASLPPWMRDTGMFGEYGYCYEQLLSPSMHRVWKVGEGEMRRRGWKCLR